MENEHRIPEEATRPKPKRTSFRRASLMAAGLALGGEGAEAQPTGSPETRPTTEASPAAQGKTAEKEKALRARLESSRFVTGFSLEKGVSVLEGTKPDDMYENVFTPEFIDWLLTFHVGSGESAAENLLQYDGASDQFMHNLIASELIFHRDNPGVSTRVSTKMRRENAETYLKFLKDTEIARGK